jgi:hypothetical protein
MIDAIITDGELAPTKYEVGQIMERQWVELPATSTDNRVSVPPEELRRAYE